MLPRELANQVTITRVRLAALARKPPVSPATCQSTTSRKCTPPLPITRSGFTGRESHLQTESQIRNKRKKRKISQSLSTPSLPFFQGREAMLPAQQLNRSVILTVPPFAKAQRDQNQSLGQPLRNQESPKTSRSTLLIAATRSDMPPGSMGTIS